MYCVFIFPISSLSSLTGIINNALLPFPHLSDPPILHHFSAVGPTSSFPLSSLLQSKQIIGCHDLVKYSSSTPDRFPSAPPRFESHTYSTLLYLV